MELSFGSLKVLLSMRTHGNLHLVGSSVSNPHHINVFVLENDYSSWSLKYCIDRRETTSCAIRELVLLSLGLLCFLL
ncbi:hypothetical protein H5410_028815 [Solanum commersonii]|uniref:Uncharacterized protein n=1 Tax=Solanum commersonii TaxID=4109 RepID=A0A9J5Z300_SOLCO|nr:hypothetical protein H5410_028815 [Solanum commersonii]